MPTEPDGPSRAVLVSAALLGLVAIGGILVLARTATSSQSPAGPVAIASVPAPNADSPSCRALSAALPGRLGDFERAAVVQPAPAGAAAWREPAGGEPVIIRCGMDRPAEFVVGSPIQVVDNVQWFQLEDPHSDSSTWISVDRPVYVTLTLPRRSGPTPIQALSDVIARVLPGQPIKPGPPN